jgi:3-deoxy-D-manno-octulosonic-acid transferase
MTFHHKLTERLALGLYMAITWLIAPFLDKHIKKRLERGKEHPQRWPEKQGFTNVARPNGKLIWLNAVGLGEVMALRGLIAELHRRDSELNFLVTSSTRTSSETFATNLPPKTIHQFLPLDIKSYAIRFLNHWRPDLVLWSEQDIWPGLIYQVAREGIPQALINARMNGKSFRKKAIVRPLFRATYKKFSLISAQDSKTASMLASLGAQQNVRIDGSLKPHCPPLFVDLDAQEALANKIIGKKVWLAASCHSEDEDVALEAHRMLLINDPSYILILAPRNPIRTPYILTKLSGLNVKVRSRGELPNGKTQIYLADTFSEMGLWYANSGSALIGGTFSAVEGHNPWEALQLGCRIMHGPRYKNFLADFKILEHAGACATVHSPEDIVEILTSRTTHRLENYEELRREQSYDLTKLISNLLRLMVD